MTHSVKDQPPRPLHTNLREHRRYPDHGFSCGNQTLQDTHHGGMPAHAISHSRYLASQVTRDESTFSTLGRRTRAYLSKTGKTLPTTSKTSSSNNKGGSKRVGRKTSRGGFAGPRAWKDSKAVARGADGGGTTAPVSTTTSVQVTVVNGLPGREDSDSSGGVRRRGQGDDSGDGGRTEGADDKTADTYREGSRRSSASRGSEGIMLPALKQGQRLVVNSVPTADGGQVTAGHTGIDAVHGSEAPLWAKELSVSTDRATCWASRLLW